MLHILELHFIQCVHVYVCCVSFEYSFRGILIIFFFRKPGVKGKVWRIILENINLNGREGFCTWFTSEKGVAWGMMRKKCGNYNIVLKLLFLLKLVYVMSGNKSQKNRFKKDKFLFHNGKWLWTKPVQGWCGTSCHISLIPRGTFFSLPFSCLWNRDV